MCELDKKTNNSSTVEITDKSKSCNILTNLFFVLICFLFISMVTNIKRHLCYDVTCFISLILFFLVPKNEIKKLCKIAIPLLAFGACAILSPCVDKTYISFGLRIFGSFIIGTTSEIYLFNKWKHASLLSSIALSIAFILYLLKLPSINDLTSQRLSLTMDPAPELMSFVAIYSIIFLLSFVKEHNKAKYVYFLALPFILCILIVYFSGTRAALVGLLILTMYNLFKLKNKVLPLVLAVVLLLLPLMGNQSLLFSRLNQNTDLNSYTAGRLTIWEASIDIIKLNFPYGVKDSHQEIKNYLQNQKLVDKLKFKNFTTDLNVTPHNVYISPFFYFGLAGFITFLLLIGHNVFVAIKTKNYLFGSVLVFFISVGFIDYLWQTLHGIFFYFFSMGVCYVEYAKNQNQPDLLISDGNNLQQI